MDQLTQPLQILGRVDIDQLGGRGHDMPPARDQLAAALVALQLQQRLEPA